MRTLFLILSFCIGCASMAQERCATADYISFSTPTAPKGTAEAAKENGSTSASKVADEGSIIKIPVVVHILYKDGSGDVSDAQVKSQIDALNRDYRRKNADTVNTPDRFKALAADAQIEFYLATADPYGRPTTGIVRKQTSIANFVANDRIKISSQGGDNPWDTKSYLNIWVGNLVAGAGYSTLPGGDELKDGVVITRSAFGTIGASGRYNMGRTATHEVGHWLGLRHIWGDTQCGDDLVYDTPQQGWYTEGCPSGIRLSCGNTTVGDMYMNFMDYTNDACMNLFTEGQKRRMHSFFAEGGAKASLLVSRGLEKPWAKTDAPITENGLTVYPNPATSFIMLSLSNEWVGKTVTVLNANGSLLQTIQITSVAQKISLAAFKPGMYFIKADSFIQKFIKL